MRKRIGENLQQWGPLFLISCLSLFIELAVIRWISGEINILAYFKNIILLAAFLGLAIGFALVGRGRDYKKSFPTLWALTAILVLLVGKASQSRPIAFPGGGDELIWSHADVSFWISLFLFIAIVIVFFFLVLFLFIPLGQATGEEMAKHPPIPSYVVNIIASLTGIWLFSLLSLLNTPPVIWFAVALVGIMIYYAIYHHFHWLMGLIAILTLAGIGIAEPKTIWSPYNRLDLSTVAVDNGTIKIPWGYNLEVQHAFYQTAVDLSANFFDQLQNTIPELTDVIKEYARGYDIQYSLTPTGSRVLVVGSGMGNDVAAALRSGMGQVVAVEIDPVIYHLGQKYHPEQPYNDTRVTAVIDDARSYFNKNHDRYDLVVFGLLDSHTLLSSLSSVRLDSFVYTIECFQQAKAHMKENGFIVVTFTANEWIEERLGRMLEEVFGHGKVYYQKWSAGTTFIASESPISSKQLPKFTNWDPNPKFDNLPLATDNWPYIYLRTLRIPSGYWQTLLVIGLLCLALMKRSFPEALKPDWHFWLLGAAFLLIEFKSITELALIFGTTWFVNSLAITGVLVMALLANLYVLKTRRIDLRWVYGLLFASILFGYFFPLARLAGFTPIVKGILGTTILSLPLFFAGMIFSESLRRYGETARPIASNFSGSAVGGILEYGSVWWGIKSLYLVAILLYVGALIAAIRGRLLRK